MQEHSDPIEIGTRRELFVDDFLIDEVVGPIEFRLHSPEAREVSLGCDRPWEGRGCGYVTVTRDESGYRLYYKAWDLDVSGGKAVEHDPMRICLATSDDGKNWQRPNLDLYETGRFPGNNIVFMGDDAQTGAHGFAPFRDTNPHCAPEATWKAVGAPHNSRKGLWAMQSLDGIHWEMMRDEPIIVGPYFDSQNVAFWDAAIGAYRCYMRDFRDGGEKRTDGRRDIMTATSDDFMHWSEPEWLEYPGAPDEQLYVNQVCPYPRAPHIYVGFPARYVERPWSPSVEALPELEHRRLRAAAQPRYGSAVTDCLFMSSRDGRVFQRWPEAFVRPGPQLRGNWTYGDNYLNWGIIETEADLPGAPPELSFYVTENYWRDPGTIFRRYALRTDGFVSLQAPLAGAEVVTRPLVFLGDRLTINFSTSAAGSVRTEIQDLDGIPFPGFALEDSCEAIGDELDRPVAWRGGTDLSVLAGRPVRLRFALSDADLFGFRFSPRH